MSWRKRRRTSFSSFPLKPASPTLLPFLAHSTTHSGVTNLAWFFFFRSNSICVFEAERLGAKMWVVEEVQEV
jgi:hypothetical protein